MADGMAAGRQQGRQEAAEEREDEMACVVCMNAPKTHLFDPCGHMCVCEGCAQRVMHGAAGVAGRRESPLCRYPAQRAMKVLM